MVSFNIIMMLLSLIRTFIFDLEIAKWLPLRNALTLSIFIFSFLVLKMLLKL